MSFFKKHILVIFLFILSLLSVVNLFHPGFPITHDGDVHLLRLTNFYQSLSEGNIIPRWAANVNWGYGQPVFEFFYPLPSYMASFFHLFGLSFANSLKLLLILSMVLSTLTMYLWISNIYGKFAGFVSGLLYIFVPFRFVEVYVRGDVGENFAFVFVPLVFYSIYILSKKQTILRLLFFGITLALLILCHNVMSIMFLPLFCIYSLYLFFSQTKKNYQYLWYLFGGGFVGFCLSAFFWIPGLFEGKFTLRDIVTRGVYAKHFVNPGALLYGPWSYGGSGLFTVQLGVIQWFIYAFSLLLVPFLAIRKNKLFIPIFSLIILTLGAIFFMLPISTLIWQKIMLLQNFQFPWRFLAIPAFSAAVLGGILSTFLPKKTFLVIGILLIGSILAVNKDYWYAKGFVTRTDGHFAGIFKGPSDTGESSPIWSVRFMESGYKHQLEVIAGKSIIQLIRKNSVDHKYLVFSLTSSRLLENTLFFPGWKVFIDGREVPIQFQDPQYRGLITFTISPGKHIVELKFVHTKLRALAEIISAISLVIVVSLLILLAKDSLLLKKR